MSLPEYQRYYCTDYTNHNHITSYGGFSLCPAGYSSNHSSLTDLSHRRSASGGSASTGIGSILEPCDQQVERGEKENRSTPEHPSTPARAVR